MVPQILELTRRDGEVLASIKAQLDRIENRLDGQHGVFDRLDDRFDRLGDKIDQLGKSLPDVIAAALRDALREH